MNDIKQNMAIQNEKYAAAALHNKKDNVKCTHFLIIKGFPSVIICLWRQKEHCEAFDRADIDVLLQVEKTLKIWEKLELVNPSVKPFLRGEQSVAVCGLKPILNLVSYQKSASSIKQADLFDFILQWVNQVKHMTLYRKRRFTKLGYSTASILIAPPHTSQPEELPKGKKTKYMLKSEWELSLKGENQKCSVKIFFAKKIDYNIANISK